MRMVRPMLMHMRMHLPWGWQFTCSMGMGPAEMTAMIVPRPKMLLYKIRHQQTLSMVPALTENIIILLTLACPLVLTQAGPLTMCMLSQPRRHLRPPCVAQDCHQGDTVSGGPLTPAGRRKRQRAATRAAGVPAVAPALEEHAASARAPVIQYRGGSGVSNHLFRGSAPRDNGC